MSDVLIKRALLSVSDKTGLAEFAHALHDHGVELISTGGTAKAIAEHLEAREKVEAWQWFEDASNYTAAAGLLFGLGSLGGLLLLGLPEPLDDVAVPVVLTGLVAGGAWSRLCQGDGL